MIYNYGCGKTTHFPPLNIYHDKWLKYWIFEKISPFYVQLFPQNPEKMWISFNEK